MELITDVSYSNGYYQVLFFKSHEAIARLLLIQLNEFEWYWGLSFFRFSLILKSNKSSDLGRAETGTNWREKASDFSS